VDCRPPIANFLSDISYETCGSHVDPYSHLIEAIKAAQNPVNKLTGCHYIHLRPSKAIPGLCEPVCPEDKPLFLVTNDRAGEQMSADLFSDATYIDYYCRPCPPSRPFYVFDRNTCVESACDPELWKDKPENQPAECSDCPPSFQPSKSGGCEVTTESCRVCLRAQEWIKEWSVESFARTMNTNNFYANCKVTDIKALALKYKQEAVDYFENKYNDCLQNYVGKQSPLSIDLCGLNQSGMGSLRTYIETNIGDKCDPSKLVQYSRDDIRFFKFLKALQAPPPWTVLSDDLEQLK
jgi:hypothetical protein